MKIFSNAIRWCKFYLPILTDFSCSNLLFHFLYLISHEEQYNNETHKFMT